MRGVGAVSRVGGVTREVGIALDPARLTSLGVTAGDVSRQLRQMQQEAGGGRVDLGGGEQPVRTLATVRSAEELARVELSLPGGRRVRLDEVARVTDTTAEPRSLALLNGKPVVGFEVSRSKGDSEVEVGAGVRAALANSRRRIRTSKLTEAFDFVTPVEEEFDGSMHLLYEGALLAVLVVWLFLRDWRATFVSAVALPLSVIPAFAGMYLLGFSLNVITLLALSLVVGILVDDAIVEVENIVRHLRMGKTPYQAAMEAADEIGLAVIATTFTLVAVFLPTAFMSGIRRQVLQAVRLDRLAGGGGLAGGGAHADADDGRLHAQADRPPVPKDGRVMTAYMRLAAWCLRHRWLTMLGAAAFFIGSVLLIPLLPTGFIPPDDNSQTQVYLELPPGSTLEQTRERPNMRASWSLPVEHVSSVYTTIGGGSAGGDPFAPQGAAEVRKATLTVLLDARHDAAAQDRGSRTRSAPRWSSCPARAARSAWAARARNTSWCSPATTRRPCRARRWRWRTTCARFPAWAAWPPAPA